jgi:hypothetical protein
MFSGPQNVAQRSGAVGKWPLSRFFNRVAHALFPPVSAVCGRGMSESILRSRRSRVRQRVERVQSWRVRPCAGQTVPVLGA